MTLYEFIDKINELSTDNMPASIDRIVDAAIFGYSYTDDESNGVRDKIANIKDADFTFFGDKIGYCIEYWDEKFVNLDDLRNDAYYSKMRNFGDALIRIRDAINEIGKQKRDADVVSDDKMTEALLLNADVLSEIKNNIAKVREELNNTVSAASEKIDSKIFSLLINTVAILGIFVAISFAGFGVTSIISNMDIQSGLTSSEAFLKNIFFMVLVALLSYNLLLLLVYFIFQLSRPILSPKEKADEMVQNDKKFIHTISLTAFYIIDGVILAITIALFVTILLQNKI